MGSAYLSHFGLGVDAGFAITRGESVPDNPVPIEYFMGRGVPSDVIFTASAYPIVVHKRVVDVLLDHRYRGWGTYPVRVTGKAGEYHPDYLGLTFNGRCGPPDDSRSEEFLEQMPARMAPRLRGLYFDPESWDGSDLFMSSARVGYQFVLGEVVQALKKAKVKNVEFEALTQVVRDPR